MISYNLKKITNGTEVNLNDILKKLPGISVENGKIYAEGKVIDKILINGEEFTLNQRTLSETLGAKMLAGIDLLKDYKQNTILNNFNTIKEQALNLTIKKEYLGVFKGEIGIGGGIYDKYKSRISSYNLGNKFRMSLIGDINNTGENPITILEFLELKGGLLSLFGNRPNPLGNQISLQNNIIPMSDNNSSTAKNIFFSTNSDYKVSSKTKVSGSFIFFKPKFNAWNESKRVYALNDKTITIFNRNDNQKESVMQQGDLRLTYRKNINESLMYKLSQSFATNSNFAEIYDSNFLWNHFFEISNNKNQYIDQELNFLKKKSSKLVYFSSFRYTFEENRNNKTWFTDSNQNQITKQIFDYSKNKVVSEIQLVYKPKKLQYEINLGCNFNKLNYFTDLINADKLIKKDILFFTNKTTFTNINIYSDISINKKNGFFQFQFSLIPNYTEINSDKSIFFNYFIKNEFYFSKNHHLDLSFKNEQIITDPQKTLIGIYADTYRDFFKSSFLSPFFSNKKNYQFGYFYDKFRTGTSINVKLNYEELDKTITSNSTIDSVANYSLTTYLISPNQKKYIFNFSLEQKVFKLPVKIKIKYNFDMTNYSNYINNAINSMSIKNHNLTVNYQTYLKKPINSNGGFYYEKIDNYGTYSDINNSLISYKPYLNIDINSKSFTSGITLNYVYLISQKSTSYTDLSPYIRYKINNYPLEVNLEGNNILNLKTVSLIDIDNRNGYMQMSNYSRLSGNLMLRIKYYF